MTRALVTQMLEAMEPVSAYGLPGTKDVQQAKLQEAIKAVSEYLATEPSGERAGLIAKLRDAHGRRFDTSPSPYSQAAEMLEADAQQAKRVPLSDDQIDELAEGIAWDDYAHDLTRRVEAHHGITPADKPTGWDNGLSQDYCAEFGQWLASRPGARQQIKAMFDTSTPLQP